MNLLYLLFLSYKPRLDKQAERRKKWANCA